MILVVFITVHTLPTYPTVIKRFCNFFLSLYSTESELCFCVVRLEERERKRIDVRILLFVGIFFVVSDEK